MYLQSGTLASVASLSELRRAGAAQGVTTIYHEATHAWFDIMSARPDVAAVAGRGRKYYAGSLRRSGKVVDDEERAFQELLQSMIPDQFASAKALKERYDALARKYPQLR